MNRQVPKILYHISFELRPREMWYPKLPAGYDKTITSIYKEPDMKRISFSETLEGCFIAIYPNVSEYFGIKKCPFMDFYYYRPIILPSTKLYSPKELTDNRWVWDAHLTKEWSVVSPVIVEPIGRVRYRNTVKEDWVKTRPYNDPTLAELDVSPKPEYKLFGLVDLPPSSKW